MEKKWKKMRTKVQQLLFWLYLLEIYRHFSWRYTYTLFLRREIYIAYPTLNSRNGLSKGRFDDPVLCLISNTKNAVQSTSDINGVHQAWAIPITMNTALHIRVNAANLLHYKLLNYNFHLVAIIHCSNTFE